MSEEEKKAVEKLKEYALCKVNDDGYVEVSANGYKHTILNLIENQQKELNNIKKIEKSHQEENGKLRVELEQEKARNEKLQYKIDEKELIIDGMKEDRRIAIEEIREEYYISKDKIEKIRKNYLKKALDIEAINMFKGTTEKEREEIRLYRNIAEILKLILEEA